MYDGILSVYLFTTGGREVADLDPRYWWDTSDSDYLGV